MRISRRLVFLPFALFLASCGPSKPVVTEPPVQIHGGWTRDLMEERSATDLPASLQSLNPKKVWRVTYKGPQDITSMWALFSSETVAFEANQKINKALPIRPFFRGAFFVILDANGVPPQALGDFQEGVTKALP